MSKMKSITLSLKKKKVYHTGKCLGSSSYFWKYNQNLLSVFIFSWKFQVFFLIRIEQLEQKIASNMQNQVSEALDFMQSEDFLATYFFCLKSVFTNQKVTYTDHFGDLH